MEAFLKLKRGIVPYSTSVLNACGKKKRNREDSINRDAIKQRKSDTERQGTTTKMDLKQVENIMKEDPEVMISDHIQNNPQSPPLDSATALQAFLDHIPISSISGIKDSPESRVLELNAGNSVGEAIELLYENNVCGAPIADVPDPDNTTTMGRFSDRYIGFIDLARIILWCLQKCKNAHIQTKDNGGDEPGKSGFFTMLEQIPQIGQTKIGELAKSFLWDPFFPVRSDDTLFHVLLLLSKHRLDVLPVIERPDSRIMGFVTQNAVIQLLLQSNGLDWFNGIADKALSEFRLENEDRVVQVYGEQSVAESVQILCRNPVGVIAVADRRTKRLIGSMRRTDIYLLLENDKLYHKRETLSIEEFIHTETTRKTDSNPAIKPEKRALLSAGVLRPRNSFLPRMDQPVTNKKTDTLKQAMKNLVETKSCFGFLVDDSQQAISVLTIRDILNQFAPPSVDSSIHGCGFFESALEQSGCKIENGTMICDH